VRLAGKSGDPMALQRAYISLTDVLTMLGRPRESAGLADSAGSHARLRGRQHAHTIAARIGANPLTRELRLLAQRARLDLAPPGAGSPDGKSALEEILGLTPREADVLALVARGYTNREIATTLVISVKTASVHVSHILHKLDAPSRIEAAAIAHRLAPPDLDRP
jgi:DNA-binding CsgD family transcriptional regulator